MTRLDCNVVGCAYNDDNCCKRSDIKVEGDGATVSSETCCSSFEKKGCGCTNSCGCAKKETQVKCEAVECMYNKNQVCHANHIGISGGHADSVSETECASFVMG